MKLVKPQQLEAERAIIKCLLEEYELSYDFSLTPEMFYGIENVMFMRAFDELLNAGNKPDVILIRDYLISKEMYEMIGGDSFFELIDATAANKENFEEYTELVFNSYLCREAIEAGDEITTAGYGGESDIALEKAFATTQRLFDLSSTKMDSTDITNLSDTELKALTERLENPGGDGFKTNFTDFDLLTGGLYETDEVIIAARPSVGKTSLALRIMLNLASNGIPVSLFSYEMSDKQLMQRIFAMHSKVGLQKIRTGMVSIDEFERVKTSAKFARELPIYINNDNSASISDIVSETRKLVRDCGVKVIIIDYIQLMPHRIEYATQDLGYIARQLKNLAMSTNTITIGISQLNRAVEGRGKKIPLLSDLRQSGNIEEHSDVVLMLYREEMYDPTEDNKGMAQMYIRKNRNGPIGVIPLIFNAPTADFRGISKRT